MHAGVTYGEQRWNELVLADFYVIYVSSLPSAVAAGLPLTRVISRTVFRDTSGGPRSHFLKTHTPRKLQRN